jgi:UDP-N-acetylmuramoyl-tripeptide--D-alanyl-D-alanine ligase
MIEVVVLPDGTTLLDATAAVSFEDVRSAQRALAEYRLEGYGTVHVAGLISGDNTREELDELGRINVRLNIQHLIVVGETAHGMHRAAEHEGSWDGESLPVLDVERAYDEVMTVRGPGVAVLVTGSVDVPLNTIAERLKESGA